MMYMPDVSGSIGDKITFHDSPETAVIKSIGWHLHRDCCCPDCLVDYMESSFTEDDFLYKCWRCKKIYKSDEVLRVPVTRFMQTIERNVDEPRA